MELMIQGKVQEEEVEDVHEPITSVMCQAA